MKASRTSEASPVLLANVADPSIAEIGGKAASLVRLSRAGFRVPEAAALPVSPANITELALKARRMLNSLQTALQSFEGDT